MADQPNLFTLHGHGVSVTLALSAFDGKAHLNYHDSARAVDFSGEELTIEKDTGLGDIATVTLVRTVDVGFTTFTLLIPVVNAGSAGPHAVQTLGVTTLHRTTLGGLGRGQLTDYHVLHLLGTASTVESLAGAAPAAG